MSRADFDETGGESLLSEEIYRANETKIGE